MKESSERSAEALLHPKARLFPQAVKAYTDTNLGRQGKMVAV
jgi:hypothetical protein